MTWQELVQSADVSKHYFAVDFECFSDENRGFHGLMDGFEALRQLQDSFGDISDDFWRFKPS